MSKRLAVLIVGAMAVGLFPLLRAQTAAPQAEKWNNIPPPLSTYKDKKPSGPAPRRDKLIQHLVPVDESRGAYCGS